MVQADTIETVLQSQNTLNFVGLDHGGEDIVHLERLLSPGHAHLTDIIGDGQNTTKVIRWMPPFSRKPGVIEI